MSSPSDTTTNKPAKTLGLLQRLIAVIEDDILPLTEKEVANGNKIFGAALLRKSDHSTYLVATNNEIQSPLHHGEMHLLKHYFEIENSERLPAKDLIFFSTHEPCSMCLSAITWSGFDNFYYFFSHEDSRDAFEIPHDLKILDEVFGLEPGGYKSQNAFWHSHGIILLLEQAVIDSTKMRSEPVINSNDRKNSSTVTIMQLQKAVARIKDRYERISELYQASKSTNSIPLK